MTIALLEPTASDLACLLAGDEYVEGYRVVDGAAPPDFILRAALDVAEDVEAFGWCAPRLFVLTAAGLVVGSGGFKSPPVRGAVEIGYGVASSARGRGFATDAVRHLVMLAMEAPDVERILAETATDNPASRRVVEKNGFTHVGRRETEDDGVVDCWTRSGGSHQDQGLKRGFETGA